MPFSRFVTRFIPLGDWVARAYCRGMGKRWDDLGVKEARGLCLTACHVRRECLLDAYRHEADEIPAYVEQYPVYGGRSGKQRATALRRRRDGQRRQRGPA